MQSSNVFKKYINNFAIISGIWILSAVIITNSFRGLLLNTYFNIKYFPIVNTWYDIENTKDLFVMSNRPLKDTFNKYDERNQLTNKIVERNNKYLATLSESDKFNGLFNEKVIRDLINGKVVILDNSYVLRHFNLIFNDLQNMYTTSEHKVFHNFAYLVVKKFSKYTRSCHYM